MVSPIVLTSACTTPAARPATPCRQWHLAGTWSIAQSNGFAITFVLQQNHDALTGTADNGSGPVPVLGTIHDTQLEMTVLWASGGSGRYTATMTPAGLLSAGFTQNLSMSWSTAMWTTLDQFKCDKRLR